MKHLLASILLASALVIAQAPSTPMDEVLEMVKEKMPDNLILKMVASQPQPLKFAPADLIKLRRAGASDKLLEALVSPTPAAAAPAEAAAVAEPEVPQQQEQPKKAPGMFGRLKDKAAGTVRRTGNRTVESAERTAGNTMSSAEKTADTAVDRTSARTEAGAQSRLDSTQQKIDKKVDSAVGPKPAQQK